MLDLLLEIGDLPPGWLQQWERRYRLGFMHNEERDRRARQKRLVGAVRGFSRPGALSNVRVMVAPAATEEDSHARLAAGERGGIYYRWSSLMPLTAAVTEVTPPPEAGEHARAFLTAITDTEGASLRTLQVIWVEPGQPMLGAIAFTTPGVLDVWEFTSALLERQRQRLARVAPR